MAERINQEMLDFIEEFLRRVPQCTCADYYKPYYPRTDPQCPLHGSFDFTEEEIERVRELVAGIGGVV